MKRTKQGNHFQRHSAPRLRSKYLGQTFLGRRHAALRQPFPLFVQDAVAANPISQIDSHRQLLLGLFVAHRRLPCGVMLPHGRSPFDCTLSAFLIGSVSHPAEGPAFSFHLNLCGWAGGGITGRTPKTQFKRRPACEPLSAQCQGQGHGKLLSQASLLL